MGRAERRRSERNEKKGKKLLSNWDIREIKEKTIKEYNDYKVEALMTCFALANHKLYGHGADETFQTLQYIDDLMGAVNADEKTIEEYKLELEKEINVVIKC